MWVVRREHARLPHCNIDAHLDVQVGTKGERLVLGESQPGPAPPRPKAKGAHAAKGAQRSPGRRIHVGSENPRCSVFGFLGQCRINMLIIHELVNQKPVNLGRLLLLIEAVSTAT